MAKFSFRHPFRSLINAIFETPERAREPEDIEPQNTGPDFFPHRYDPGEGLGDLEDNYQAAGEWQYITGESQDSAMGQTYWEIFEDTGAYIGETRASVIELWRDFIRAFWLVTDEPGHMSRADWYDLAGVDKGAIDWQAWREVKHSP